MQLLKLFNSVHFGTYIHPNLFKKPATHAHACALMGAPHTNAFLEFNAMYGEALRCGKTATPSTNYCERSEQIELLKFLNVNATGEIKNA